MVSVLVGAESVVAESVGAESVVAVAISRDEELPAQVTSSESVTDPLALSYRLIAQDCQQTTVV